MKHNTLVILSALVFLSACGIKPDQVDPPSGAENSPFPRTYPAPDANAP